MHRINIIQEAYNSRFSTLNHIIRAGLINKRDQLLSQIYRIDYRMEEIKFVKTIIERDIRTEFAGMLEGLKSSEGKKLAVLQHDMAELQRDLDKINDIVNTVKDLTGDYADNVGFLMRARTLHDNVEFCIAKPFKTNIEITPHDLPRDLTKQRDAIGKFQAAECIIDFKDQVIFALLKEKISESEKVAEVVDKVAQEEINEWAK